MGQGIYKNEKQALKSFWYNGTDTLKQGYAMCFDRANITGLDGSGTAEPATDYGWARHGWVVKPASGNLHNFAGIVAGQRDVTGPAVVSLIEPEAIARGMNVFTSGNLTIDSTFLTIVAGSYEIGVLGEGLLIGKALQTVDRSSTSGLAQAMIRGVDPMNVNYGAAVPSSTNNSFSPLIWETCPWDQIESGMLQGLTFYDDFRGFNYALAAASAVTHLNNGVDGLTDGTAGSLIAHVTDEARGVLTLESTTDQEDIWISEGGNLNNFANYIFSSTTKLWMEARVKTVNITDSKYNVFLGFAEEGLMTNAGLITTGDAMTDKDFVGFERIFADGDKYDTVHNTDGGGGITVVEADAVTVVADTYQNLGIYSDGTTVTFYNNGVAQGTTVALTATNFPDGEKVAFMYGLQPGHGDLATTQIDWLRIAHLS